MKNVCINYRCCKKRPSARNTAAHTHRIHGPSDVLLDLPLPHSRVEFPTAVFRTCPHERARCFRILSVSSARFHVFGIR
jgi:hypothetical protein